MNRQTFHQYLEEPSKLYQLSLTELQSLVMDYPYSSNLRLLLLLKARLEGHPKAELITSQVAARTFDRAHLYRLLTDLEKETEAEGETLELRGLEELDVELLEAKPLEQVQEEEIMREKTVSPELEASEERGTLSVPPPLAEDPDTQRSYANAPDSSRSSSADKKQREGSLGEFVPKSQSPKAPLSPSPLKARLERLKHRQLARLTAPEPERAEASLKQIARRSVSRHRGVASETLAQLLVGQGQYQRAIKMYEELSLAHPEKKSIFAGLIKELKEKL
ncbi:MAG: hypothetical protein AAF433_05705 [Bacteroidota bacterium]